MHIMSPNLELKRHLTFLSSLHCLRTKRYPKLSPNLSFPKLALVARICKAWGSSELDGRTFKAVIFHVTKLLLWLEKCLSKVFSYIKFLIRLHKDTRIGFCWFGNYLHECLSINKCIIYTYYCTSKMWQNTQFSWYNKINVVLLTRKDIIKIIKNRPTFTNSSL